MNSQKPCEVEPLTYAEYLSHGESNGSGVLPIIASLGRDFFRQPAANRIGDANHRRVGMILKEKIGLACGKQGVLPVSLSEENRGFGLCDNRKHNPGSNGANDPH